jgi:hypothetical protein
MYEDFAAGLPDVEARLAAAQAQGEKPAPDEPVDLTMRQVGARALDVLAAQIDVDTRLRQLLDRAEPVEQELPAAGTARAERPPLRRLRFGESAASGSAADRVSVEAPDRQAGRRPWWSGAGGDTRGTDRPR